MWEKTEQSAALCRLVPLEEEATDAQPQLQDAADPSLLQGKLVAAPVYQKARGKDEQRGARLVTPSQAGDDSQQTLALRHFPAVQEKSGIPINSKCDFRPKTVLLKKGCTEQGWRGDIGIQLKKRAKSELWKFPPLSSWTFANCFPVEQLCYTSVCEPVALCSHASGVLLLLHAPSKQGRVSVVHYLFPSVPVHASLLAAAEGAASDAAAPCLAREVLHFNTSLQHLQHSQGAIALVCARGETLLLLAEDKRLVEPQRQHEQQQQSNQQQAKKYEQQHAHEHQQHQEHEHDSEIAARLVVYLLNSNKEENNNADSSSLNKVYGAKEANLADLPRWPLSQNDAAPRLRYFFSATSDEQSQAFILFGGAATTVRGSMRATLCPWNFSSSRSSNSYSSRSSEGIFLPSTWEALDDLWSFCCQSRQWRQPPRKQQQPKSVTFAASAETGTVEEKESRMAKCCLTRRCFLWPPALAGHSAAVYRGCMFVFGGYTQQPAAAASAAPGQQQGEAVADLWSWNIKSNAWRCESPAGRAPLPRFMHASSVVGSRLLIYGGRTAQGPLPLEEMMYATELEEGPKQRKWTRVTLLDAPPPPQLFLGAAACCSVEGEADALFLCSQKAAFLVVAKEIQQVLQQATTDSDVCGVAEDQSHAEETQATDQTNTHLQRQYQLEGADGCLRLEIPGYSQAGEEEGCQQCSTAAVEQAESVAAAAAFSVSEHDVTGEEPFCHAPTPDFNLQIVATPMTASAQRRFPTGVFGAVGSSASAPLLRQPHTELLFNSPGRKPQLQPVSPVHATATPIVFRPRHRSKRSAQSNRQQPQRQQPAAGGTSRTRATESGQNVAETEPSAKTTKWRKEQGLDYLLLPRVTEAEQSQQQKQQQNERMPARAPRPSRSASAAGNARLNSQQLQQHQQDPVDAATRASAAAASGRTVPLFGLRWVPNTGAAGAPPATAAPRATETSTGRRAISDAVYARAVMNRQQAIQPPAQPSTDRPPPCLHAEAHQGTWKPHRSPALCSSSAGRHAVSVRDRLGLSAVSRVCNGLQPHAHPSKPIAPCRTSTVTDAHQEASLRNATASQRPAAGTGAPWGPPLGHPAVLASAHVSSGAAGGGLNGLQALMWWFEAHASVVHDSRQCNANSSGSESQEAEESLLRPSSRSSSTSSNHKNLASASPPAHGFDSYHRETQRLAALMYSVQPGGHPPGGDPSLTLLPASPAAPATTTNEEKCAADSTTGVSLVAHRVSPQVFVASSTTQETPNKSVLPFPRPVRKVKRSNPKIQTTTPASSSINRKSSRKEGVPAKGKISEVHNSKTTPNGTRLGKSLPVAVAAAATEEGAGTAAAVEETEARARKEQAGAAKGCKPSTVSGSSNSRRNSSTTNSSSNSRPCRGSSSSSSRTVPVSSVSKVKAPAHGPRRPCTAPYPVVAAGGGPVPPQGAASAFGRMWRRMATWPPEAVAALLQARETVQKHSSMFKN
ncbi:hypothetical protein, conserved [Eimeria maxima]|uniref:Kelch motif domain-containing protein n=1 Tax=Eimeria maxima TaxID=5804 RepID=U6M571_EIMMA|nr:hypothetical protein, conserved [Eimeria maxima]CDJ58213.1 hypothetical protein, conserved [Eimeria maxima]